MKPVSSGGFVFVENPSLPFLNLTKRLHWRITLHKLHAEECAAQGSLYFTHEQDLFQKGRNQSITVFHNLIERGAIFGEDTLLQQNILETKKELSRFCVILDENQGGPLTYIQEAKLCLFNYPLPPPTNCVVISYEENLSPTVLPPLPNEKDYNSMITYWETNKDHLITHLDLMALMQCTPSHDHIQLWTTSLSTLTAFLNSLEKLNNTIPSMINLRRSEYITYATILCKALHKLYETQLNTFLK